MATALLYAESRFSRILRVFPLFGFLVLMATAHTITQDPFAVWTIRGLGLTAVLLWYWLQRQRKSIRLGHPIPSPHPLDALEVVKLLKSLERAEPHCLWSGRLGQLWGLAVTGHVANLPFAQKGNEVWLFHLDGSDLVLDVGRKAIKMTKGQFLKLPEGIGPAGLRSDRAFIAWAVGHTKTL